MITIYGPYGPPCATSTGTVPPTTVACRAASALLFSGQSTDNHHLLCPPHVVPSHSPSHLTVKKISLLVNKHKDHPSYASHSSPPPHTDGQWSRTRCPRLLRRFLGRFSISRPAMARRNKHIWESCVSSSSHHEHFRYFSLFEGTMKSFIHCSINQDR
jgi:hypothetical protein